MRRDKKDRKRDWIGVLGEAGVGSWIHQELAMEEAYEARDEAGSARPVSVRLAPEPLALLDAFATRFRLTRSGMLLRFIEGGLAEAFHAMPAEEQEQICRMATANAEAGGHNIKFGSVELPPVMQIMPDGTKRPVKRD